MASKIYEDEALWDTKEADYHSWMQANVEDYTADQWAKKEWSKHPDEEKWHVIIPKGHSDTGEELTEDWRDDTEIWI